MNATHKPDAQAGLLPNFLICGAPKAGTSSLHRWLADHPDVLGSTEKETYFFVDPGTHMYRPNANALNGLSSYRQYFNAEVQRTPKVVIESTPSYIYYETALRCIPDLPSAPKCLFILREPAQQIYSMFTYFQNNWSWIPSGMRFAEYIDLIRQGEPAATFGGNELAAQALRNARYVDFLQRWRERLGDDRIMVRSFEALKRKPRDLVAELAEWLSLDVNFYADYTFPNDNETYSVRSKALQRVNVAIRAKLPKGDWYDALRGIYRNLNTRKPDGPSDEDIVIIDELSREFAEPNMRLREAFGMELRGWK